MNALHTPRRAGTGRMPGAGRLIGVTGAALAFTLLAGCAGGGVDAEAEGQAFAADSLTVSGLTFAVEEETDELVLPYGIAVGPTETTYIVAGEPDDRYLVVWHPDTGDWQVVDAAAGGFDDPREVSVSSDGEVYVANAGNDTISVGDAAAETWSTLTDASFNVPTSVDVGPGGEIVVINAGDASISVSLDGGSSWELFTSEQTGIVAPAAIDIGRDFTIAITDIAEEAVVIGLNGGESWEAIGPKAGFARPEAVASGPDGTIYVANSGDDSLSWSEDRGQTWSKVHDFGRLATLSVAPDGSLFVTDGVMSAGRVSTTPGPPERVTVTRAGNDVTVAWDPSPVTGGRDLTGYTISLTHEDGSVPDEIAHLTTQTDDSHTSVTFSDVTETGLRAAVQASNDHGGGILVTEQVPES